MKYYEFHDPYYALIRARNKKEAAAIYIETVAGDDEENKKIYQEAQEVPEYYAAATYARAKDEDGNLISMETVIKTLENKDKPDLLLIDGTLI